MSAAALPEGRASARRDAALICAAALLRSTAVSLVGVTLAIHLAAEAWPATDIGLLIGAGLAGSSLATVAVSVRGDRWGRRRTLIVLALFSAAGYLALAALTDARALMPLAFVGMLNGMGRDRGAASALEQAILPAAVGEERRTWMLAWYNVVLDVGHAVGAIAAALPSLLSRALTITPDAAHRLAYLACAAAMGLGAACYVVVSRQIEVVPAAAASPPQGPRDPRTSRVIARLALLFGLDSLGGGFLNSALIAYWFFSRYGVSEAALALLFFAARVLNALSHLAAAALARRIGLLNTMVWTHLPSSVLLMAAPASPDAAIAAGLFLAREALVEMDVPTRQSYVLAVVPPHERTFASGVTNVTRNVAWALGPSIAGVVMQQIATAAPLLIGGGLKITYDLLLYAAFRDVRPPEERVTAAS
jgi:MFS family permease